MAQRRKRRRAQRRKKTPSLSLVAVGAGAVLFIGSLSVIKIIMSGPLLDRGPAVPIPYK